VEEVSRECCSECWHRVTLISMQPTTPEKYLDRAIADSLIDFKGEGKSEKIIYRAWRDHTERWSDPEEKVRAEFYAELIYRYEYEPARVGIEVVVPRRTSNDRADIVVFKDLDCKDPFIVIECKRDGISDAEFNQAIEQACGNRSNLDSRFTGVVAGATRRFLDFEKYPNLERQKNVVADLPVKYGSPPEWRFFKWLPGKDLSAVSREDLRTAIRKCHQTLWEGGKRSAIAAFGEFSKIIFVKIRDETNKKHTKGTPYQFQRRTQESNEELAKRIHSLYDEEKQKEPDVFTDRINIEPNILALVVEHIEGISLSKTDLDTKGVAFEEFMGGFFKGDFGQYFTPRELIAFAIHMLPPSVDDKVLDPACGSGGFLLYTLDYIRDLAALSFPNHATDAEESKDHYGYWHDFAAKNLFGIEINEELARVAKMNMIIHDDGHTNIIGHDALDFLSNIQEKRSELNDQVITRIYTNPPFGSVVKASEKGEDFLEQYDLRKYISKSTTGTDPDDSAQSEGDSKRGAKNVKARASVKTEILFLERIHDLLKAGTGKAAVILPDGILTNASLQGVRDWLIEHFQIMAVVSFPQFAFSHYDAGVKSSILFLRKRKDNEKINKDEAIFMSMAENIGYDATGRKTFVVTVEQEIPEKSKIELQRCDLFDYRVHYEWNTSNTKKPIWSEMRREVIPHTGIVGEYRKFERNPKPFFV
jgi:type I restriction enzyme M protein